MQIMNGAQEDSRLESLIEAEEKAFAFLAAIEKARFIQPGRTEREVELDIRALAQHEFGIERHWHKRIVRAGANTLADYAENPPVRIIGEDDMVFLDLGPVFGEWEADVGRSYVIGSDPLKHALGRALPVVFASVKGHYQQSPDITGAELYAFACKAAEDAGWRFGGKIAGHIIAEFPHARTPGEKEENRIGPHNHRRMRDPDAMERQRHWILEIHLVAPDGSFGGFCEQLLEGRSLPRG